MSTRSEDGGRKKNFGFLSIDGAQIRALNKGTYPSGSHTIPPSTGSTTGK
jgi:hypothetical protein